MLTVIIQHKDRYRKESNLETIVAVVDGWSLFIGILIIGIPNGATKKVVRQVWFYN